MRRLTRRWITLAESRGSEGGGLWVTRLTWTRNREGTTAWRESMEHCEGVDGAAVQGPCDMAKTRLFEAQFPAMEMCILRYTTPGAEPPASGESPLLRPNLPAGGRWSNELHSRERTGRLRHARYVQRKGNSGSPKGREPYGDGVPVVVVGVTPHRGERESRSQGQVAQVSTIIRNGEVRVMQRAEALTGDHPEHWRAGCGDKSHARFGGGSPEKGSHTRIPRRRPTLLAPSNSALDHSRRE